MTLIRPINKAINANLIDTRLMRELEPRKEFSNKFQINVCNGNETLPDPVIEACAPHNTYFSCSMDK